MDPQRAFKEIPIFKILFKEISILKSEKNPLSRHQILTSTAYDMTILLKGVSI